MQSPMTRLRDERYLQDGRLTDVLALMQLLALYHFSSRSENALVQTLGLPGSAVSWTEVATKHPEFFRVKEPSDYPVCLLARHAIIRDHGNSPGLPEGFLDTIMTAATGLHDRQSQRS